MKYLICLTLAVLTVMSCKKQTEKDSQAELEIEIDIELEELISLMTGSFNSERQSKIDTSFRDVSIHMYPIWQDREGKWLYVEQSLSDRQEEPYRQRIYKLSRENDSTFRSDIYTIPNAGLWACRWQTPEFFDRLLLETISIREGCEVLIKKVDDKFIGKTRGKNCPSDLQGATYVTSEVEISNNRIVTWDRGFNELDSLVWGALKGGYIFDKIN
jgi:CpeT protein